MRRIIMLVVAVFMAVNVVSFVNAPAAHAATEFIYNDCGDGSDYSFSVVTYDNVAHTLPACRTSYGWLGITNVKEIRFYSWECAYVKVTDHGGWSLVGSFPGGGMLIDDGWTVHVDPHKVYPSGYCY